MAELLRIATPDGAASELYLRIPEFAAIPPQCRFGLLPAGQTSLQMLEVERTAQGWKVIGQGINTEYMLHSVLKAGPAQLCIFDSLDNGTFFFKSELQVDRSFYGNAADWLKLFEALPYTKPGRLAVFTHVYNEKAVLEVFLRCYTQLVAAADIYVINHGSDRDQIDHLRNIVHVVDIPRGETDHYNISAFCGHFQRFLLTQYDWVLHVDADELVLHEHGFDALRAALPAQPNPAILRPAHAYELIHDIRSEPAIDLASPVSLQRSLLVASPAFHKPVIASRPTTWTIGFHSCLEPDTVTMEQLWLVHLRDFDFERSVERDRKWSALRRSALDAQHIPRDMTRPNREQWQEILLATLEAGKTVVKHDSGIGNGPMIALPDWMRGAF
ncbi:glycosyltransferase family 2 protein [Massilia sp. YMA4]|uniref:glycosyltransferase family 2 protein n=1 Tax=Massilia sp. YMA4 TaxID=1593482 RepID=UPI0018780CB5|nr:glycosyltransferase family 2 protein [Massilia sp. YMA4]